MTNHKDIDIPEIDEPLLQECLTFLDGLREGGKTNMLGATPPLMTMFPQLTKPQARQVVGFWMATYSVVDRERDQRAR